MLTDDEKRIVEWLRKPWAGNWTCPNYKYRLWFAWHLLLGSWAILDGVRLRVAQQIETGDHRKD